MNDPYSYLQEQQECASPTGSIMETSYASSDDGMSPWSGLSSIARHVASSINRSAKSLINELAELEYEARGGSQSHCYDSEGDGEGEGGGSESGSGSGTNGRGRGRSRGATGRGHHTGSTSASDSDSHSATVLPLPWEICFQSTDEKLKISIVQKEDEPLKEKILALSKDESIFTGPFNEKNSNEDDDIFILDDSRVMLIRRLLEIDSNLGYTHARVSGRSTIKEKIFWMNYFFHCEKLRENREKEINDQSLRRALHDDELDAELVGRPPASCTGFYPRTGKLSLLESIDCDDNRVIPSLPNMGSGDDFVMVDSDGVVGEDI
mmetsp:Transcript_15731/g.19976  ORF Transcript_15731/g.19976 Transcript_15731/m.19976 type:complete len:322 (+) Transcript_15731:422-1387(+)|eukprot:CAMPEP_0203638070 /NCGR_PEP_ID=MMETSP0088-20131115/4205_1 /ASSEMBLY_ACC=CAM_ASM_001087 /TAXON_ID=426623 /ORGANISM="Chaetoceros affinis, Strain CCMP159" /LENGTH=321 /DNA_ID=CAMNT_0050492631 /DNA_START=369 /DNA_END=1334 /DNA_ORIENTATION=+